MISSSYCNPLSLPDYPVGLFIRQQNNYGYLNNNEPVAFRETADPSVLYENGLWYLYASGGMVWVSGDLAHWEYHPFDLNLDYAPCVVNHRGRYYLTASSSPLYVSDSPLGPWTRLGIMQDVNGEPYPDSMWDPMMFSDLDGRLYLYWGCGRAGIYGVELDPENPLKAITPNQLFFTFNPEHTWECAGEYNEDTARSYVEGAGMFRHGNRYYLTYCAPGTEYGTYATGCYVGESPLGPFRYQDINPIQKGAHGLVRGCGHSCVVAGPNDTVWNFYTSIAGRNHYFERRIGCDLGWFDESGNLRFQDASEVPQQAPGSNPTPEKGNSVGLLPVSVAKFASASSQMPARGSSCGIDNSLRTWWEAAPDDKAPVFEVNLKSQFDVSAMRIIWAEPVADFSNAKPGPWQYVIEGRATEDAPWTKLVDASGNSIDLLIDYRPFETVRIQFARVRILGGPANIPAGITEFTLFGKGTPIPANAPYGKINGVKVL